MEDPERSRKRKTEDDEDKEEGEVPDLVSQRYISDVANFLVLLANSSPTIPYLLMRATKLSTHFEYAFDDDFRNDVDTMDYGTPQSTNPQPTNSQSTQSTSSGIVWQVTPELNQAVVDLYKVYDEYDCGWESIDFCVFVDESGENWCFKCVFTYPATSSKKRCVVSSLKKCNN